MRMAIFLRDLCAALYRVGWHISRNILFTVYCNVPPATDPAAAKLAIR